ncbi:hypothetical protein HDU87_007926 [Geranomyces variabilis]|uniref:Autophagy-related protein 14 n=1 Tax=Geranomyces variabilis TaxID=109894 RepID=A0AAD5TF09_9FUNG|nr:hypothetical protein HDU87_007926 [Geranomyces variabilis]
MECPTCSSTHKPFWCTRCLSKRLRIHKANQAALAAERAALAEQIAAFHGSTRPPSGISPTEEAFATRQRIARVRAEIQTAQQETGRCELWLQDLRRTLDLERTKLDRAQSELARERISATDSMREKITAARAARKQTEDVLAQSRRLLVRELLSIFKLRKVQRRFPKGAVTTVTAAATPPASPVRGLHAEMKMAPGGIVEYRIVNVPLPVFSYGMNVPRERFNAAIGHTVHLCVLLFHYLHISMPYLLASCGDRSYARARHEDDSEASRRPLYLTDSNADAFIVGLAMLNYNVAFLCHSQGVLIPIYDVPNTLENLVACCQAPDLGREFLPESSDKDPTKIKSTQPPNNEEEVSLSPPAPPPPPSLPPFLLEFGKVVRLHVALHKRRWGVAALARLRAAARGDGDGVEPSSSSSLPSTAAEAQHVKLLTQILDETSEDEDESGEWHLVDDLTSSKA